MGTAINPRLRRGAALGFQATNHSLFNSKETLLEKHLSPYATHGKNHIYFTAWCTMHSDLETNAS